MGFFTWVVGLSVFCIFNQSAWAWGGRGHHVICSAAVHLVKEPGLKDFLQSRGHTMGHLCNVPDIYWKSLPKEVSRIGDSTHFIDPEVIGLPISKLSLDFKELENKYTGTDNQFSEGKKIFSFADDFGSIWWRVDQFMNRLVSTKKNYVTLKPPQDRKEEQDEKLPFNKETYELMVNMGLLGHFIGDASQPLHNTADYDGYKAGHGGLHSYYEEQSVSVAPADLENRVFLAGKKSTGNWLKGGSIPARMKSFSEMSAKDLVVVFKKDPLTKKSELKIEKGMSLKTPAERPDGKIGWKKYEVLIVKQMGQSAKFLATLWDEAYVSIGRPELSKYRSYKYPFTPDFVPPDYIRPAISTELKDGK